MNDNNYKILFDKVLAINSLLMIINDNYYKSLLDYVLNCTDDMFCEKMFYQL